MKIFFVLICLFSSCLSANPFLIDFADKQNLSNEDYLEVQTKLRQININPLLNQLYAKDSGLSTFDDFHVRCTKGLRQVLIDPAKGFYPYKKLIKIGNGGDRCIVNCCPFERTYVQQLETIPQKLQEAGFNGYIYYLVGGFPNPTGREIKFAGVPYCFKVLAMQEAHNLGFNNILWVDSSIVPLRNLMPIFDQMDRDGCFLLDYVNPEYNLRFIFPQTREILKKTTGSDVVLSPHISTQVWGLKMNTDKAKKFLNTYYKLLEMGTPFLSCFPEEFVYAAIFQQSLKEWPSQYIHNIIVYNGQDEEKKEIENAKLSNYFFYLRKH